MDSVRSPSHQFLVPFSKAIQKALQRIKQWSLGGASLHGNWHHGRIISMSHGTFYTILGVRIRTPPVV